MHRGIDYPTSTSMGTAKLTFRQVSNTNFNQQLSIRTASLDTSYIKVVSIRSKHCVSFQHSFHFLSNSGGEKNEQHGPYLCPNEIKMHLKILQSNQTCTRQLQRNRQVFGRRKTCRLIGQPAPRLSKRLLTTSRWPHSTHYCLIFFSFRFSESHVDIHHFTVISVGS